MLQSGRSVGEIACVALIGKRMDEENYICKRVSGHTRRAAGRGAAFVLLLCVLSPFTAASLAFQPPERNATPAKVEEFVVEENDSIIYTLKLAYDQAGLPSYFFRNVFTPVCFTDVCKPVYIDIYWDLLGNYVRYEVPPDEPLTKVDHKEFDEDDHKQLHSILSNRASILKDYSIYELVDTKTYNLSDSVDAVTGATPKTIKNEVIGGAVYTCYTLWHIANGPVVDEMRRITESKHDARLIDQFLKSHNHHYQYWAIDKVISTSGKLEVGFLPAMLGIIRGTNIFTAGYALKRIPSDYFSSTDSLQQWLWSAYQTGSYRLQMEILEKLKRVRFSDTLAIALSEALAHTNQEQFRVILERLTTQAQLPEEVLLKLIGHLEDPVHGQAVFDALSTIQDEYQVVNRKLKQIKRR